MKSEGSRFGAVRLRATPYAPLHHPVITAPNAFGARRLHLYGCRLPQNLREALDTRAVRWHITCAASNTTSTQGTTMITKEQALALTYRQELHYSSTKGCIKVRVSGKCKTWKTRPTEFRIPIKHGLYDSGAITDSNASQFHLSPDCTTAPHKAAAK